MMWIYFSVTMALASLAGCHLVNWLPWTEQAKRSRIDVAAGIAAAPFLVGIGAVMALSVFPGATHASHIAVVFAWLGVLGFLGPWAPKRGVVVRAPSPFDTLEKIALSLLACITLGLLINALLLPLAQNDALEYATVGRELFHARSLDIYPLLNAETNRSGFYAPWTHPPLYVSLIYFTHLLQADADTPGLMRLIAPWCALSSALLVMAMGSVMNRRTGFLAALLFLFTPLFFFGADAALIDALPVLGCSLMLAVLFGLEKKSARSAVGQGVIIGLALWTHSQAILLVPLMLAGIALNHGLKHWRKISLQGAIMLVTALLIACAPYLRNLDIFGALISDTPQIFAIDSLHWKDYFAYNRGIVSLSAKIQYGLFKGLFALEAYGVIFWLMLAGIIYYFRSSLSLGRLVSCWWDSEKIPSPHLVYLCVILMLIYMLGVLVSIALDIDLMIRNERYMMTILPFAALVSAWFVERVFSGFVFAKRSFLMRLMIIVALMMPLQFALMMGFRFLSYEIRISDIWQSHETILLRNPDYAAIAAMREHTHQNALILSLRPADMYYAQRKMLSYLDPRLLGFYREQDARKALKILHDLGVTYVHVPNYSFPVFYHGALMPILASTTLSKLIVDGNGHQLYALQSDKKYLRPISITNTGWIQARDWIIGGRKGLLSVRLYKNRFDLRQVSSSKVPLNLFQRDFSTSLISPYITLTSKHHLASEYRLDAHLKGEGMVELYVQQFNEKKDLLRTNRKRSLLIGGMILSKERKNQSNEFIRRFRLHPDTKFIKITAEHYGNSNVKLQHLLLSGS